MDHWIVEFILPNKPLVSSLARPETIATATWLTRFSQWPELKALLKCHEYCMFWLHNVKSWSTNVTISGYPTSVSIWAWIQTRRYATSHRQNRTRCCLVEDMRKNLGEDRNPGVWRVKRRRIIERSQMAWIFSLCFIYIWKRMCGYRRRTCKVNASLVCCLLAKDPLCWAHIKSLSLSLKSSFSSSSCTTHSLILFFFLSDR